MQGERQVVKPIFYLIPKSIILSNLGSILRPLKQRVVFSPHSSTYLGRNATMTHPAKPARFTLKQIRGLKRGGKRWLCDTQGHQPHLAAPCLSRAGLAGNQIPSGKCSCSGHGAARSLHCSSRSWRCCGKDALKRRLFSEKEDHLFPLPFLQHIIPRSAAFLLPACHDKASHTPRVCVLLGEIIYL